MLKKLYNTILRPYLPDKIGVYHTVPIKDQKLFDAKDYKPYRKYELLNNIQLNSFPGNRVLVFGGGRGLAAVVAARRVLPSGEVIVYEAAREQCERTRQTVDFNLLTDFVTVKQAIVGSTIEVWGETDNAAHISPSELPQSEVWAMDIQGGEVELLEEAINQDTSWPNTLIIEPHPENGASVEKIKSLLDNISKEKNTQVIKISEKTTAIDGHVIVSDFD